MYVCFASSTTTIRRLGSRSIELRIAGTDLAGQDSIGVLELLGQSHVLLDELEWYVVTLKQTGFVLFRCVKSG